MILSALFGPIPADAGEPDELPALKPHFRAYPRGRGGARKIRAHTACHEGLSPRTRGSPAPGARLGARPGPIPADAGEPAAPTRPTFASWAYPRGRGGAVFARLLDAGHQGLSPRTRGSPAALIRLTMQVRPIPADAGEPCLLHGSVLAPRAYPRGRGGASRLVSGSVFCSGLSPRTRGSPVPPARRAAGCGPIPADAGEPWK